MILLNREFKMKKNDNEDIFDAVFNVNKEQLLRVLEKDPKQINLRIELVTPEEKIGYDLEGRYCLPIEILVANSDLSVNIANEMLDIFLERGVDLTQKSTYEDNTLLHTAAFAGNPYFIKKIIDAGVEVNAVDMDGNTALHLATCNLKDQAVKLLLENGAEPSTIIENKAGNLPINSVRISFIDDERYKTRLDKVLDMLKPITERELNKEFSQGINNHRRPKII